jgi:hypothetical protein
MGAFDEWCSGLMDWEDIQEAIHFRERHVAMVLPPEELKARWEKIGYLPPKQKQLELFQQ